MGSQNTSKPGERFLSGREGYAASFLEALSIGTILELNDGYLIRFREGLYFARHSSKTAIEIILGGSEGQFAAIGLDAKLSEALNTVEKASKKNNEAGRMLEQYVLSFKAKNTGAKALVEELVKTYSQNEIIGRQCARIKVQLEGIGKIVFDIGNDIKPSVLKEVDSMLMLTYGRAMRAAGVREYEGLSDAEVMGKIIEGSEKLSKFYKEVRHFYDARENQEHMVKQFSNYLATMEANSKQQNSLIEEHFPNMISMVKEGYSLEDVIFKLSGKGTSMENTSLQNLDSGNKMHKKSVDNTTAEIRKDSGIKPGYHPSALIDYTINPLAIACVAAVMIRGLKTVLPRSAVNAYDNLLVYPIKKMIDAGYSIARHRGG